MGISALSSGFVNVFSGRSRASTTSLGPSMMTLPFRFKKITSAGLTMWQSGALGPLEPDCLQLGPTL